MRGEESFAMEARGGGGKIKKAPEPKIYHEKTQGLLLGNKQVSQRIIPFSWFIVKPGAVPCIIWA